MQLFPSPGRRCELGVIHLPVLSGMSRYGEFNNKTLFLSALMCLDYLKSYRHFEISKEKMRPLSSPGKGGMLQVFRFRMLFSCVSLRPHGLHTARQASLSVTNPQSLLKLMSIESVMPSNQWLVMPSIRVEMINMQIRATDSRSRKDMVNPARSYSTH